MISAERFVAPVFLLDIIQVSRFSFLDRGCGCKMLKEGFATI